MGEMRGGDSGPRSAHEKLIEKNERLKRLRELLEAKDREIDTLKEKLGRAHVDAEVAGVRPESMIWLFGAGRTGSTWLASMMESLPHHEVWREPLVGELFGHLYYSRTTERHHGSKHFVLGRHREAWVRSVKTFVLDGATVRFPETADGGGYLVVKEPNGSIGAPLLMEALPESRMVLLVRDPRDVVASVLDANTKGSWRDRAGAKVGEPPGTLVRERAEKYAVYIGNATKAYEAHGGPKTLTRYEDLRADALGTMKRIYSELGIPAGEADLARAVEEHSWEQIPEEEKGEGKFYRKATPGGWKEDLTPEQVRVVEEVTAPLLERFYPGTFAGAKPGSSPGSA